MAALSGFYHISGYAPGEPPCPPYGAYTDFIAPRFAACALLAALDYRRRTGRGQYIDMSQYEAALHNLAPALVDYFASGRVRGADRQPLRALRSARRLSMRRRGWPRAMDGAGGRRRRRVARDAVRAGQSARGFALRHDGGAVGESRRHSTSSSARWCESATPTTLTVALQAAGVSAYPVQNCVDIHRDDNLEAFGFWHWLDHKVMGPVAIRGAGASDEPHARRVAHAGATLGQHNDEVFGEMLGLDAAEIARLKEERVIF